ncbi:NADH-quinone oxidoreductase subunit J [Desulfofalx alkaliphila]|uniref:NADH-quinone oxidoreductase subunit J family protein n=1 Tax=Desulfofalx alkaliphila TaxID=105483 RepID=UPI0004E120F2|nr:NADH-quinone oxidoreductase subunit J [Desulfofalx alkaliphila]
MEGITTAIAFWMLAAVILGSALMVVVGKHIVHSVLCLVVTFLGTAGVFLILDAKFLAAIQVLVYAGSVSIMIVFGVMLTQRGDMKASNLFNKRTLITVPIALLTLVVAGLLAFKSSSKVAVAGGAVPADTVGGIGALLFSNYLIPFELAGVLVLVVMIGAVFLTKEVKANADND